MTRPLFLLHGALGSSRQFDALIPLLQPTFDIHTFDFEGHGLDGKLTRPLRIDHFVAQTVAALDTAGIARADFFGYSMGGFVACRLALAQPARVGRIVTLGTRYPWDPATAARENRFLDPVLMRAKVPHFAAALAAQHGDPRWETLVAATAEQLEHLGRTGGLTAERLSELTVPVRVIVGDRDRTAGVDASYAAFSALQHGEFEVLPGTPHPFDRVDPARIARALHDFL